MKQACRCESIGKETGAEQCRAGQWPGHCGECVGVSVAYIQPTESLESSLWSKGQGGSWGGSWHRPPVQGQGKHPLEVGQAVFQQSRQVRRVRK